MAFDGIYIDGTLLSIHPESYSQEDLWLGENRRNLDGGLLQANPEKIKKRFVIEALTKEQYEALTILAASNKVMTFRDGIPITERSNSRTIHETVTATSSYIYYVPLYSVRKSAFSPTFTGNRKSYTFILDEV